jgi:hypothetical protein
LRAGKLQANITENCKNTGKHHCGVENYRQTSLRAGKLQANILRTGKLQANITRWHLVCVLAQYWVYHSRLQYLALQ